LRRPLRLRKVLVLPINDIKTYPGNLVREP
jgi:hypothetical protein